MSKIIFFGNQKLVQGIKPEVTTVTDALVRADHQIIATISSREDLAKVPLLLSEHEGALAVLASFGYIVPETIIDLFEPLGILNIHPSLLPRHRGPTPIESAILSADRQTGVSIMKLAKEMDAGPIYAQESIEIAPDDTKFTLAARLTTLGADLILQTIADRPVPRPQQGTPTFTKRLDKSLSPLDPEHKTAAQLDREVRAYLGFPKSKFTYHAIDCTILKAHPASSPSSELDLICADGAYLVIDLLQPASRSPMTPADFLRGYARD